MSPSPCASVPPLSPVEAAGRVAVLLDVKVEQALPSGELRGGVADDLEQGLGGLLETLAGLQSP